MSREIVEILHVDDNGEICIKCLHCGINRMVGAPKGTHIISVRCNKCRRLIPFKVDWRKSLRKKYWGRICVGLRPLSTIDLSLGGISFEEKDVDISPGTKINIKLPINMAKGNVFLQPVEIEIVSRQADRYGAKFLNLADESKAKKRMYS